MIHVWAGWRRTVRFHHATQNGTQLKIYELFISSCLEFFIYYVQTISEILCHPAGLSCVPSMSFRCQVCSIQASVLRVAAVPSTCCNCRYSLEFSLPLSHYSNLMLQLMILYIRLSLFKSLCGLSPSSMLTNTR